MDLVQPRLAGGLGVAWGWGRLLALGTLFFFCGEMSISQQEYVSRDLHQEPTVPDLTLRSNTSTNDLLGSFRFNGALILII